MYNLISPFAIVSELSHRKSYREKVPNILPYRGDQKGEMTCPQALKTEPEFSLSAHDTCPFSKD